ncbi:hypothetical protein Godav_018082 [Gossypium davidsonii]|uniref:Uncharacterized protein n=1 Tax=Gossypium davidsonii TaxID=34287 RepID=A0A7J8QVH8_GOSDV|nr:hypothetical protein [Gossypium davidsonii]
MGSHAFHIMFGISPKGMWRVMKRLLLSRGLQLLHFICRQELCEKKSFYTNNDDSKFQCSLYPSVITYFDKFLNIIKTLIHEIFIFSVTWIAYSFVVYEAWNLNLPNGCAM